MSRMNEWFKKILREIHENFPMYFIFIMGWGLLHYEASNVNPAKYQEIGIPVSHFTWTVVVPVFWLCTAFFLRFSKLPSKERWIKTAVAFALIIGSMMSTWFNHREKILSSQRIVTIYEFMQFFWAVVLFINAWATRGFQRALTFFGVCLLYGVILENTGIIIGFFGESQYRYYLGISEHYTLPAPIATILGWAIMFYVSTWLAEYISRHFSVLNRSALGMAVFTSILATSLDFQIDPMASLSGVWWKWDPRLPGWFLGVPFMNFLAWFVAFIPFTFTYYWYRNHRPELSEAQKNLQILIRIPWFLPAALTIGALIFLLVPEIHSGPAKMISLEFLNKLLPY